MVLSVKTKTLDRFWTLATVISGGLSTAAAISNNDIGQAYTFFVMLWGYWEFFRCSGDYEYDVKGVSCQ